MSLKGPTLKPHEKKWLAYQALDKRFSLKKLGERYNLSACTILKCDNRVTKGIPLKSCCGRPRLPDEVSE